MQHAKVKLPVQAAMRWGAQPPGLLIAGKLGVMSPTTGTCSVGGLGQSKIDGTLSFAVLGVIEHASKCNNGGS